MCQFAHAQARAACDLAPENKQYRVALAAAQYRLGKFQKEFFPKALATLGTCDPDDAVTRALLAMTQYRLDDRERARTSLATLRKTVQTSAADSSADAATVVHEAERLIGGDNHERKEKVNEHR